MKESHHHHTVSGHQHFVVTEDLYPLMRQWANRHNFVTPDITWFARNHQLLHRELGKALNKSNDVVIVDSLPYHYIASTMKPMIYDFVGIEIDFDSIISLDQVYIPEMSMTGILPLQITRGVNVDGQDLGRIPRPYSPSLDEQVKNIHRQLSGFNNKVIVIDDGIWTGETMEETINILQEYKINVVGIVVGVATKKRGHSVDLNLPVKNIHTVQLYDYESRPILDWVCERDFFPCTPYGGRTVISDNISEWLIANHQQTAGAYYVENPRWLEDWASIDDPSGDFSRFCIDRSISLFKEVERLSNREVRLCDLDRVPFTLASDRSDQSTGVVEALEVLLHRSQKTTTA